MFYLHLSSSYGDEDKMPSIGGKSVSLDDQLTSILNVLAQPSIGKYDIQLICCVNHRYARSSYNKLSGKFGEWVDPNGRFVEQPNSAQFRVRMDLLVKGVNCLTLSSDQLQFPHILGDYLLVTEDGDKKIFGEDQTHYYTSCGISIRKSKAFLRCRELELPQEV